MKSRASFLSLILALSLLSLSACEYQRSNRVQQRDVRENSRLVYGPGKDSAAVQLKNQWPDNPRNDQRAQAIREKFFDRQDLTE